MIEKPNNGWISVDDKSLKQYANKEILIYTAWGNIKKAIYSVDNSPYIDDDGKEYQFSHWFSDEFGDFMWEFDEVKYWQPYHNHQRSNEMNSFEILKRNGRSKEFRTIEDVKDWIENVHYPAQVEKYLEVCYGC